MSLKIIGAGFGRTGTKSLQLALETLGFDKCYHMEALFRNPEGVKQWTSAYKEESVDWETLFKGYQSIVDFHAELIGAIHLVKTSLSRIWMVPDGIGKEGNVKKSSQD